MIFEDDEKDNNDFDISIDSNASDEISWDDLIDVEFDDSTANEEIKFDEVINTESLLSEEFQIDETNDNLKTNDENNLSKDDELQQSEDINIQNEENSVEQPDLIPVNVNDGLEGITIESESQEIIEDDLDNFLDLDNLEDQTSEALNVDDLSKDEIINQNNSSEQDIQPNEEIKLSDMNNTNIAEDELIDNSSVQYDMSDITGVAIPSDSEDVSEIQEDEVEISTKNNGNSRKVAITMGVGAAVLLVVAIIVAISLFGKSFVGANNEQNQSELSALEEAQSQDLNNLPTQSPNEGQLVPGMNNQQNTSIEEQKKQGEEKVLVSVTQTGRSNPFSPTGNMSMAGYTTPSLPNIAPPGELNEDKEIGKMVEIVCTGILYDNVKPSAIITVGGVDYFVQKGDRVDKFIVSAITPTSVVIRSGRNAYVASIGQQFDVDDGSSRMKYVYNGKSKPVTRQYLSPSPSDIEVKVK